MVWREVHVIFVCIATHGREGAFIVSCSLPLGVGWWFQHVVCCCDKKDKEKRERERKKERRKERERVGPEVQKVN